MKVKLFLDFSINSNNFLYNFYLKHKFVDIYTNTYNVTKPTPLNTYHNQIKHLTSLNSENNIKNIGNINLTTVTQNQIISNINKTQITGLTMKNNFLKNNSSSNSNIIRLNNTTKNINNLNNKIKYNINNNTDNRISEHMEESKKYDSIRSKVPINKINSKSFSKNKTNNNSKLNNFIKDENINVNNFINSNSNSKLIKKNSEIIFTNDNKNKSKNSNIRILTNENIGNLNTNSNKNIISIQNQITLNKNLITSNSKKRDLIKITSKENVLQSKEDELADFILNNVEPLKLNDYNIEKKGDLERFRKISYEDLNSNINAVNIKYKNKNFNNHTLGGKNNNKKDEFNDILRKTRIK